MNKDAREECKTKQLSGTPALVSRHGFEINLNFRTFYFLLAPSALEQRPPTRAPSPDFFGGAAYHATLVTL